VLMVMPMLLPRNISGSPIRIGSCKYAMTLYTEGFSRFVFSTTAPIATGWSERLRAGLGPNENSRLFTAHIRREFGNEHVARIVRCLEDIPFFPASFPTPAET
jgi:hypothetical protein